MSPDYLSMTRALLSLKELGWTPGGIVDIGVATGTVGLYTTWPGVPIALIEPSPAALPFMNQIAAEFPNVQVFNFAASDRNGEIVGGQVEGGLNVGFGKMASQLPQQTFQARTCDDMVAQAALPSPLLLKIDTDTHEGEVLAGAAETLARSDVVVMEAQIFHAIRGGFEPMQAWAQLSAAGFAFFDIGDASVGSNDILRALDIVFLRRDQPVFRTALERSRKSAAKMQRRAEQYASGRITT